MRPHRPTALLAVAVAVATVGCLVAAPSAAGAAGPSAITTHARKAVAYAQRHHVTSSIAVVDTTTGQLYTGGSKRRHYAAASTAKIFTAVMILARHKLTRKNRPDMWAMITQSDNAAWSRLQAQVGRGHAITSVEKRYGVQIGTEPAIVANSGESMVTASGMARMYAAIKHDKRVWPWLGNAMAHISRRAAGGTDQLFGIPAAAPRGGFALKQGWLRDRLDGKDLSVMHSTGYVDDERYVVCIFSEAPGSYYEDVAEGRQGRVVSGEARRLLPHGRMR